MFLKKILIVGSLILLASCNKAAEVSEDMLLEETNGQIVLKHVPEGGTQMRLFYSLVPIDKHTEWEESLQSITSQTQLDQQIANGLLLKPLGLVVATEGSFTNWKIDIDSGTISIDNIFHKILRSDLYQKDFQSTFLLSDSDVIVSKIKEDSTFMVVWSLALYKIGYFQSIVPLTNKSSYQSLRALTSINNAEVITVNGE